MNHQTSYIRLTQKEDRHSLIELHLSDKFRGAFALKVRIYKASVQNLRQGVRGVSNTELLWGKPTMTTGVNALGGNEVPVQS